MVRGAAISQFSPTALTHGQILWIALNNEIDAEEQKVNQCEECRMKSQHRHCVSCGKVMASVDHLDEETREALKEAAKLAGGGE